MTQPVFIVTCTKQGQRFCNWKIGYRVISFKLTKPCPGLELDSHGEFTISGNTLDGIVENREYTFQITKNTKTKYSASYILSGLQGLEVQDNDGTVAINPEYEVSILKRYMTDGQAKNVNEAYPHFVQMILNNQEDQIDTKNIKNVGKKRFASYVEEIKKQCRAILIMSTASKYGFKTQSDFEHLGAHYENTADMVNDIQSRPYYVYVDVASWSFNKADDYIITNYPDMYLSDERCVYMACHFIEAAENDGHTLMPYTTLREEKILYHFPEYEPTIDTILTTTNKLYTNIEANEIALATTHEAELNVAQNIVQRLNNPIKTPMVWEPYTKVDEFECTYEQSEILRLVQDNSIMMLTGSGGTGKTTSTIALIHMLEGNGYEYTLLAPTGIAAKKLSQATRRTAQTIDLFLVSKSTPKEFLIIDETSMVSITLMSKLLKQTLPETKIIFICDEAQLPSISCGNLVQDLLDSAMIPRANLTKVFRYGVGGIATVSTDTRLGNSIDFSKDYNDCHFIDITDKNPLEIITRLYADLLSQGYTKDDIMIITPKKIGDNGVYQINEAIQDKFNKNQFIPGIQYKQERGPELKFKVGDKILCTKNSYHVQYLSLNDDGDMIEDVENIDVVVNGDIGKLRDAGTKDDTPYFDIELDKGIARFEGNDIQRLTLGYAITVHKSQGSQAKIVIFLANENSLGMLNRNIEYVGTSRAQEILYILSTPEIFNKKLGLQENKFRRTALLKMILDMKKASAKGGELS